jgi:glycogen synthase
VEHLAAELVEQEIVNILLVNYECPPIGGGAATAVAALAGQLTSLGHAVTVLTSRFRDLKDAIREGDVHVVRCLAIHKRSDSSSVLEMFSFLVRIVFSFPIVI